jgi:Nucleotidyl transferase AbiEii toxin, Type IV TA system
VEFPQVNVRAHRSGFKALEKLFGLPLDEDFVPDEIKGRLLCRSYPALLRRSLLGFDQHVQGVLPCARRNMRGGTVLHKVHLAPPSRYSEDTDLVAVGDGPEGYIRKALNRVLKGVLGTPKQSAWANLKPAIRNTVKPSRVLPMTYAIPSLMEPGTNMEIVVEADVTERKPHRPVIKIPFEFPFRDAAVGTKVNGYDIHEMPGTKMRALFSAPARAGFV